MREKTSEWPHFASRGPDSVTARSDRRIVTNPNLTLSTPSDEHSAGKPVPTATPLIQQFSQGSNRSHVPSPVSRRNSPQNLLDIGVAARSVPATPLGVAGNPVHLKTPGTPHTSDTHSVNARLSPLEPSSNNPDLQASLSRGTQPTYDTNSRAFDSIQAPALDEVMIITLS